MKTTPVFLCLALLGCGDPRLTGDAGLVDSAATDSGSLDAGASDAGPTFADAGLPDAGVLDAGLDASVLDADLDAGGLDAGLDAGPPRERFVDVALSSTHGCAVRADGALFCWGANDFGETGAPPSVEQRFPVQVTGLDDVTQVATSSGFTCALRASEEVYCWGRADMLGGSTSDPPITTPQLMSTLSEVVDIGAERINACALTRSGVVSCWGENGSGGTVSVPAPMARTGLSADQLAVGSAHVCVHLTAGGLRCWGYGQAGRLGTGNESDRLNPTPVSGLGSSDAIGPIAAGDSAGCAVVGSDTLCWGSGSIALTGGGFALEPRSIGLGAAELLDVGIVGCAVVSGALRCWGSNGFGGLGTGSTEQPATPFVTPVGLTTASALAVGASTSCAIQDGTVYCWGGGPIGGGTGEPRYIPTAILPRE